MADPPPCDADTAIPQGGLIGWQSAGYSIESGVPASTQVAYMPKPRPGAISADEFSKIARAGAADKVILDLRDPDEANAGIDQGRDADPRPGARRAHG